MAFLPKRLMVADSATKSFFESMEESTLIQHFKDQVVAGQGASSCVIQGKGVFNNRISEYLMSQVAQIGVSTQALRALNMREQLVTQAEPLPFYMIVRNAATGRFGQRFGLEPDSLLVRPMIEFFGQQKSQSYPWVTDEHIVNFGWCDPDALDEIRFLAMRVNDFLRGLFAGVGLSLLDCRLEFGRSRQTMNEHFLLINEITPDSCRLRDRTTQEIMDRRRCFLPGPDPMIAYQEVARRLGVWQHTSPPTNEMPSS
jgi:phosphoribosylaminoimidazole-succinocarboxamide synthase